MAVNPFEGTTYDPAVQAAKPETTPLVGKAAGARALQSATFGFGADAAEAISPGAGKQIRGLADQYNQAHPLAGLAMDVATGVAYSAVAPEVGLAKLPGLVRAGVTAAGYGALQGAGAGGDMSQRATQAGQGALMGALAGPVVHGIGSAVAPVLGRAAEAVGLSSPERKAAAKISDAMAKDKGAQAALAADPSARLVDVSPAARAQVQKAVSTSASARRAGTDIAQADADAQAPRLGQKATDADQPFLAQKQKLIGDLGKLQADQKASYAKLETQINTPDSNFDRLAALPSVKQAFQDAMPGWQEKVAAGYIKRPPMTPQQAAAGAMPMTLLDSVQRRLNASVDQAFTNGDKDGGTRLRLIHDEFIDHMRNQGFDFRSAYDVSRKLGAIDDATSQAQQWGAQFSKGLKQSEIDTFNKMSPLEQQHARLGFVNGVEDFLRTPKPLSEQSLHTAANAFDDPTIRQMVGPQYANSMKRTFKQEAARTRNSKDFATPVVQRDEQAASQEGNMANYSINRLAGNAIGSIMSLARRTGMSEAQAQKLIQIAASPNGAAQLQNARVTPKLQQRLLSLRAMAQGANAQTVANLSGAGRAPMNAKAEVTVGDPVVVGTEK